MAEIQKANALPRFETDNYILVGRPGGGKSILAGTLPGKTLVFAFDLSARAAYSQFNTDHVDILEYFPEQRDLTPYTAADLRNKAGSPPSPGQKKEKGDTFLQFGADFNRLVKEGIIPGEYNNLVLDSATSMQDHARDSVMAKSGRAGETPGIDDYNAEKRLTSKVFDTMAKLPVNVVFILHDETVQDETTKKVFNQMTLTGNLRTRIPQKVGHLIRCFRLVKGKSQECFIQTIPDHFNEGIRTSFQGLDGHHDVMVHDLSKPWEYGLGKIIQEQKKLWTKQEIPPYLQGQNNRR